jgi:hypothetical protein
MTIDRIKLCALAAAVATTLTGEVYAQATGATGTTGSAPALTAPAGNPATPQSTAPAQSRTRNDPTSVQGTTPAATQPSASKGVAAGANSAAGTTTGGTAITGGVPGMSGVTPNRAELSSSAFTKLDSANRGYLTPEDVRQLDGFESAFRQFDQNGDGRLNQSEFNAAWSAYTGNSR